MKTPTRATVWLAPAQVDLVREVAEVAGLSIAAAGTDVRGQSGHIAARLDASAIDDLRAALAAAEGGLFLIADPGSFGAGEGEEDVAALLAARSRGVIVATLEPIPATPLALSSRGWTEGLGGQIARPLDAVSFVPAPSRLPPFREGDGLLEAFGPVRTATIEMWSAPVESSLGARLYAAMDLLRRLIGEPETIDAAYAAASQGRGVHALPGETLRGLNGDITANCRFADGRAATLTVSNQTGAWGRAATLLGAAGRVRVRDDLVEWVGPDGQEHDRPARRARRTKGSPAAAAIADGLSRLLGHSHEPPHDHAGALAMCHATILSCRTGQGESPAMFRRLAGVT